MKLPAAPRSKKEVKFFVDECPCERCGARGFKNEWPAYGEGRYEGTCVRCGAQRVFEFQPLATNGRPPLFQLGFDEKPSPLFTPAQLRAVAERDLAPVPADPSAIETIDTFRASRHSLERALTALNELRKFGESPSSLADEVAPLGALHAAYENAESVVDAKVGAHAKPTGLDGRFIAHRKWVNRGRVGDGQLVIRGENWHGISRSTPLMSWAVIEDTRLEQINLSHGDFVETVMRRARLLRCNLQMSRFERLTFDQCDLRGAQLSLADLLDVVAKGGDWQNLVGGRSTWRGRFEAVDLRGSQLRDAVFDRSTFETCDLRGMDLRRKAANLTSLGVARNTRFVDCDLRGMEIEGWRLNGVVFERCRMHGIMGTPVLEGDVTIQACDFSESGDAEPDGLGGARLLSSWRGARLE